MSSMSGINTQSLLPKTVNLYTTTYMLYFSGILMFTCFKMLYYILLQCNFLPVLVIEWLCIALFEDSYPYYHTRERKIIIACCIIS